METNSVALPESEFFLQWGNRKRNRSCARAATNNKDMSIKPDRSIRTITSNSNFILDHSKLRSRQLRNSSSSSPDNNNHYTTRGSSVGVDCNNIKINNINTSAVEAVGKGVWPKLYLGLSNKEKEEDFMAMKGCKPPHRPKKRPKAIQRSVLMVCPGGWLADMCQERYEVREKKSSKKRPRGLKGMGALLETDDASE